MNESKEDREIRYREERIRRREIWEVQNARSTWDEYHPDNIRAKILRLQRLLTEAGV